MSIISRNKTFCIITVCALVVMVQTSCAGYAGGYGGIRSSLEVSRMFETHKILPDHRYYYSGPDANPAGIIGIHHTYTLTSKFWKPVDLTPRQLKDWVDVMKSDEVISSKHYGAWIVDPTGKRIGIWYSPFDRTAAKIEDDNQVIVHTPDTTDPPQFGIWEDKD